ncbi:MAG: flagellar biosynthesis anti-sigma factor FlgM [Desulfosarcinaceae bacterium]
MKITGQNTPLQLDAYLKQVRQQQQNNLEQQGSAGQAGRANDTVQLSNRAREVQQAASALKAMPDVRQDKVQQVKMDIDKGTYQVSGQKTAQGMLQESLENDFILRKINIRA